MIRIRCSADETLQISNCSGSANFRGVREPRLRVIAIDDFAVLRRMELCTLPSISEIIRVCGSVCRSLCDLEVQDLASHRDTEIVQLTPV